MRKDLINFDSTVVLLARWANEFMARLMLIGYRGSKTWAYRYHPKDLLMPTLLDVTGRLLAVPNTNVAIPRDT